MFNKKILALATAAVMIAGEASAGTAEADAARKIGEALRNEFSPDRVSVTVSNDGKRAWAECAGAVISGIKIKEIKLDAAIDPEAMKSAETGEEIISCIESSKGEITLAERDVNEYFASGEANTSQAAKRLADSPASPSTSRRKATRPRDASRRSCLC